MAGSGKPARNEAEALLTQLQRLTARAGAVGANDRAKLLALLDDIQTVRNKLIEECARLDQEMKRAAVGITAARAYTRGARAVGPRHGQY